MKEVDAHMQDNYDTHRGQKYERNVIAELKACSLCIRHVHATFSERDVNTSTLPCACLVHL